MVQQIDVERFMEAARKATQLVYREAVIKFVKAAILRVAVDSGMSRGSFLRLGELLQIPIPINPQPGHDKIYRGATGKFRVPKDKFAGRALATRYGSIQDIVTIDGNKLNFSFATSVYQYFLQEFGFGRPSTQIPPPWHSAEDGKRAFLAYVNANLKKRLPDLRKYIIGG